MSQKRFILYRVSKLKSSQETRGQNFDIAADHLAFWIGFKLHYEFFIFIHNPENLMK